MSRWGILSILRERSQHKPTHYFFTGLSQPAIACLPRWNLNDPIVTSTGIGSQKSRIPPKSPTPIPNVLFSMLNGSV